MKLRTSTIVLFILFSIPTFSVEEAYINQLSMEYEDGVGKVNAGQVNYRDSSLSLKTEEIYQEFSFKNSLFELNFGGIEFKYQLAPEGFISKLRSIHTKELNLDYIPYQKLNVSTLGISLSHSGGSQVIPEASLQCQKSEEKSGLSQFINPCLELARVSIPSLQFDQLSSQTVAKSLTGIRSNKGIDRVQNVSLLIFKNQFQLSFKAKFVFNLNVYAQGSISYDEENGSVSLILNMAKVGYFSIKSRLLKELKDAGISGLEVIGNKLIFKL